MTVFIGTDTADTIAPAAVSPRVVPIGPDAAPGNGDDLIHARDGNDTVAGGKGADIAFLGSCDDVFGWDPGDGSDTVVGQAGSDRLVFNGDENAEVFSLSGAGGKAGLYRDVDSIAITLAEV